MVDELQSYDYFEHEQLKEKVERSEALIALLPTEEAANRLVIPGGEPANELHLTLFYLGENENITPEQCSSIISHVTLITQLDIKNRQLALARVFGVALWNPHSDNPSLNINVRCDLTESEEQNSERLDLIQVKSIIGYALHMSKFKVPQQYRPWSPHICLGYGVSLLDYYQEIIDSIQSGQIEFDRLVIAFGGDYTYVELKNKT